MYISEFLVGVIATILFELALFIAYVAYFNNSGGGKK
jgi:hypothetical protein|nr:MAG TPA: Membrane-associated protein [Caudoviricetes sp.]